jgi:hypothetical protein
MHPNDIVLRRVIILAPSEHGMSNFLLVDFAHALHDYPFAQVHQKVMKTGGFNNIAALHHTVDERPAVIRGGK